MNLEKIILKGGNRKMMRVENKQERGITLIALVVTIVVLLILAGVSLNALFSNNGIINKAQQAQDRMNEAVENDQKGINELENFINTTVSENNDGKQDDTKITFTMDGKQYQTDAGITFEEFLKTSSYTSNPLTTQKKCSNCGKDITFNLNTYVSGCGYYSSDDTTMPHIRLYSNTDLYIKSGDTISPNPVSALMCAGSVLQNGITITLTEMCSL